MAKKFALATLAILLFVARSALAVEVEPSAPTVCQPVTLLVTRSFQEDCAWRALVNADVKPGPEGSIDIILTPQKTGVICLPVAREVTFRVPFGALPAGNYNVTAKWSDLPGAPIETLGFKVEAAECPDFQRGDANADGLENLSDAVAILGYLFLGGPISCLDAADTDSSSRVALTDAVFLLNHLFLGGPPPEAPFPDCGKLPDEVTSIGCDETACKVGGEPVWMEKPDGCVQCEPCTAPAIDEVVKTLVEAGIEVLDSEMKQLAACEACHVCPSGRLYRVQVARRDVAGLEEHGWSRSAGL